MHIISFKKSQLELQVLLLLAFSQQRMSLPVAQLPSNQLIVLCTTKAREPAYLKCKFFRKCFYITAQRTSQYRVSGSIIHKATVIINKKWMIILLASNWTYGIQEKKRIWLKYPIIFNVELWINCNIETKAFIFKQSPPLLISPKWALSFPLPFRASWAILYRWTEHG